MKTDFAGGPRFARGLAWASAVVVLSWGLAPREAQAQAPRRPAARVAPVVRPRPVATATPTPAPTPSAAPTPTQLGIDHPQVGCFVVGKYPKLSACFTPASELVKADLFFRAEKSGSGLWYKVAFAREGACYTATLPKPTKALVKTNVLIYAGAVARQWGESRIPEYAVPVVESEGECQRDKPVAPFVNNASVQVLPSMPPGFAAGGGFPVVPVLGAGGAGAVGVAVAMGGGGGGGGAALPTPTPPPAPGSTPTPTPTPNTPTGDLPPNVVCRTTPDPPQGPAPLSVEFNLCRSEDPEGRPLMYRFDFGDGGGASGFCRETHTYPTAGTFSAQMCVTDGTHPETCCTERVRVDPALPPPTGGAGCTAPQITVDDPRNGFVIPTGFFTVTATASSVVGIDRVEFMALNTDTGARANQTVTAPPWVWRWNAGATGPGKTTITGTVFDRCPSGPGSSSSSVSGAVFSSLASAPEAQSNGTFVVSDLAAPQASGRVVVNGGRVAPVRGGLSEWDETPAPGANRVEAQVVEGGGAGTWRFQFRGSFRSGSLRVLAGEASLVTHDTVVFRLTGKPGERVAFSFDAVP